MEELEQVLVSGKRRRKSDRRTVRSPFVHSVLSVLIPLSSHMWIHRKCDYEPKNKKKFIKLITAGKIPTLDVNLHRLSPLSTRLLGLTLSFLSPCSPSSCRWSQSFYFVVFLAGNHQSNQAVPSNWWANNRHLWQTLIEKQCLPWSDRQPKELMN